MLRPHGDGEKSWSGIESVSGKGSTCQRHPSWIEIVRNRAKSIEFHQIRWNSKGSEPAWTDRMIKQATIDETRLISCAAMTSRG